MTSPSPIKTGPGNIPVTALVISAALVLVTFISAITFLVVEGKPTEDVFKILTVLLTSVSSLGSTAAVVYSAKSAKRSDDAARSVNGELQGRMKDAAVQAITETGLASTNTKAVTP